MKRILLAGVASLAVLSAPAMAGSVADPVIEAPVIVEAATSSSSGETLVLLLALLMTSPLWD